ncbi:MAG TPA: Hpt domain-containing protein, partial [Hydrogenophaga sp.]|nr:Hpt domain-containing protein [Hydrogenophaga sp.]
MTAKDEEFLHQLRATFKVEAAEHLQAIGAGLLDLEKTAAPDAQGKTVETVFRAAHSLKGAARAVDFIEIESLCQLLEDVFATWKRRESAPSSVALDALHRALDAISATLAAPAGSVASHDLASLRQSLRQEGASPSPLSGQAFSVVAAPGSSTAPDAAAPVRTPALGAPAATAETTARETVRIAVAKLETLLLESEEMLIAKLNAGQRAVDLQELAGRIGAWRTAWVAVEP